MKKVLMVCILGILCFKMAACDHSDLKQEVNKEAFTCQEIYERITADIEMPKLVEVDPELFFDRYGISLDTLDHYFAVMPLMSAHANEILVLKAANEKSVVEIETALEQWVLTAEANMLYPEQKQLIMEHQLVTKGKYILLVIDAHAKDIVKNFEALFE